MHTYTSYHPCLFKIIATQLAPTVSFLSLLQGTLSSSVVASTHTREPTVTPTSLPFTGGDGSTSIYFTGSGGSTSISFTGGDGSTSISFTGGGRSNVGAAIGSSVVVTLLFLAFGKCEIWYPIIQKDVFYTV